jgi:hypothetical protein
MGLDMNAYKTKSKFTKEVDFNDEIYGKTGDGEIDFEGLIVDIEEIAYWRKHPNLHGWMEQLYRKKGGTDPSFNGDTVLLTEEDIDSLKIAVLTRSLPSTSGFFFGESKQEINFADLEFIEKAKQAIKEGYTIYYDSSW